MAEQDKQIEFIKPRRGGNRARRLVTPLAKMIKDRLEIHKQQRRTSTAYDKRRKKSYTNNTLETIQWIDPETHVIFTQNDMLQLRRSILPQRMIKYYVDELEQQGD